MGADTKIEWCDDTFNPFRGCVEVSEGCDHCYAREKSKRNPTVLGVWGADKARVLASDSKWREPLRWNTLSFQQIQEGGKPRRVFCASIADVFENNRVQMVDSQGRPLWHNRPVPYLLDNARTRLWTLIENTPYLRWLLLTKRPQNILRMLPDADEGLPWREMSDRDYPHGFGHVWFGTTVESQRRADERIPALVQVPARVRFLSCEPLLGPIDLSPWLGRALGNMDDYRIDWVIVGGESGGGARPMQIDWVEEIVGQCRDAKVPVFVKQFGKEPHDGLQKLWLKDSKKGGDPSEWPDHLQVRQFPEA